MKKTITRKKRFVIIFANFFCLLYAGSNFAQDTLLASGSTWKYLDDGSDQNTAWYATGFNDAAWAEGASELGYGDGDEATTISYGGSATAKFICSYFRKTITVANPSLYADYTLNIVRDDGIVVYVNGVEAYRDNMPAGTITYTTGAATALSAPAENAWNTTTLPGTTFSAGTNEIAVEIHQSGPTSSDLSFNFELLGNLAAGIKKYSSVENFSMKVYPNSFSERSTIEYTTPVSGKVQLEVYDITGKKVMSVVNAMELAGPHKLDIARTSNLSPGFYFVKLGINELQLSQKISILNN